MNDTRAAVPGGRAGDDVSLAYYLLVLWRFKVVIVVTALIGGGAALAWSLFRAPVYEAGAALFAAPAAGEPVDDSRPATGPAAYAAILQSQSLVHQALKETGLSGPPHNLQAAEFLAGHVITSASADTNIVRITVRFRDPQLAARVANRLAEGAVSLARDMEQNRGTRSRESYRAQVEEAARRLAEVQRKLESLRRTARVDSLAADVDAMMQLRREQPALSLEIEEERAKLAKAEEQLARELPTRPYRRLDDARKPADAPKPGTDDPYANPVYDQLAQHVADGKARLAGLEARLRASRKETSGEGRVAEYHAQRAELSRLEAEFDNANQVYLDASTRYEAARSNGAVVAAPLQVIDQAVPPTLPMPTRTLRNVFLGGAVGAIIAMLVALAIGSVRAEAREEPSRTTV